MEDQRNIWNRLYKNEGGKWRKETLNLPPIFRDKKILELGVGNGKTLKAILRQKPKEIIAIDISKEAIKLSKDRFKRKNTFLMKKNVKKTGLKRNYFDIIVCYYILNNLLEKDRQKAVVEMARVLKRGGIILFEDFSEEDLREKRGGKIVEKGTFLKENGIICHFFSKMELVELFSKFSNMKIDIKVSKPIKNKPDLIRKIISAEIKK
ncbi:MAG: class I SAM-dependent methyltransferase [Nanoarchaeota archaeon]|nr:class I SAM-dependent methyltransferase [Nanoarchaeota archaeon]